VVSALKEGLRLLCSTNWRIEMSKLKVSTFVTLDGVMQAPGDAGEFDRGGWQIQFFNDAAGAIAKDGLFAADARLLGE
jgi:hypothetical protein